MTSAAKHWCFTLNNYTEREYEEIKIIFNSNCSNKWIIGKEIGESGTPHLQGYVNFFDKKRMTALKKINSRIHWEQCKGTQDDNILYCMKDNNYENSPNLKLKKPLQLLDERKLYQWQQYVIDIIRKEPDERTIHWFWEPTGKVGKTALCKLLCGKYDAVIVDGKKTDILYAASEFETDIYLFDFERSMETYISYGAMEKLKNGLYMTSKYESKPIVRNCPHIICFANFAPDKSKLSADRWNIEKIDERKHIETLEEYAERISDYRSYMDHGGPPT